MCTDICVLHTVYDLRVRGYEVVVRRDLVDTYDAPGHDAGEFNRFALAHIGDSLGARGEWGGPCPRVGDAAPGSRP